MFYFSDHESYIEINPLLTSEKAFMNGFSIGIWFRVEQFNGHQTSDELSTLFSIYSNGHGGFEAYFEGNSLYYKTLSHKGYVHGPEPKAEFVYEFEPEVWYSLYIMHNKKYLTSDAKFIVNGEIVKEPTMEYPKMEKVGKLDRGFICKNFTGQVSTVMIFNGHVKTQNAMYILSKFPNEVNPEKFLEEIESSQKLQEDKVKEKLFCFFSPSRAQ